MTIRTEEAASAPPTYEELLRALRPTTALLYRVVWRYSQRPGRACRLPLRELGRRLHVGQSTILLHMRALVAAGYVVDLTPERRNKVHEYVVSGKPVCGGDAQRRADPALREDDPSRFAALTGSTTLCEHMQ